MALLSIIADYIDQEQQSQLQNQSWDDVDLIIRTDWLLQTGSLPPTLPANIPVRYSPGKNIHQLLNSKYCVFLHPGERWQNHSLLEFKQFIQSHPSSSTSTSAGLGFVSEKQKTTFIAELNPKILTPNNLAKNYDTPVFFNPAIKYFFLSTIIQEENLSLALDKSLWPLEYAKFCLDYFCTLFVQRDHTEPNYYYEPLPFTIPATAILFNKHQEAYAEHVHLKRDIWLASPWSKIYWKHKWSESRRHNSPPGTNNPSPNS